MPGLADRPDRAVARVAHLVAGTGLMPGLARLPGCVLVVLVSGCAAVGPDPLAPALPVPDGWATPFDLPIIEAPAWWSGFADRRLDALVAESLAANPDLVIAGARLAEAQALVRAERSDLYPIVDGVAEGRVSTGFEPGSGLDQAGIGATLAWSPDLSGRTRRRIQAAASTLAARVADRDDARRQIVASVAEQYIEYRRTGARLSLLDEVLELQRQTLAVVEARLLAGLAAELDVQRATADVARTQAQRGALDVARARAKLALAVLLGRAPGELDLATVGEHEIPNYAGGPGPEVPASLARTRPDLRSAEASLLAAVATIGVETADLYPTLRLPGRISASVGSATDIVGKLLGILTATLDLPLLDAGRRRAEIAAADARAAAALAQYRRTLLTALNEVENALVAIRAAEDRRAEFEKAVAASEQAYAQLTALNREGLATFLEILDAQRTLILNREFHVETQAELARAVVALHRATGAPTEVRAVPTKAQAAP